VAGSGKTFHNRESIPGLDIKFAIGEAFDHPRCHPNFPGRRDFLANSWIGCSTDSLSRLAVVGCRALLSTWLSRSRNWLTAAGDETHWLSSRW